MPKVLIVEVDLTFATILVNYLSKNNYSTSVASTVAQAQEWLQNNIADVILLDYRLPDGTGLDVLSWIHTQEYKTPIVMMTSFHDIKTAVQAIKRGAQDYITKPIHQEELLMLLHEVIHQPKQKPSHSGDNDFVKGNSASAQQMQEHIALVAGTNMTVLIQGESGTGKEHVACALHNNSPRLQHPFIAVDCGALSVDLAASELFGHTKGSFTGALHDKKGLLELAHGGTIFLDEVGNLPYDVQVKLLRVFEEREIMPIGSNKRIKIDVRIISATNEDFKTGIQNGNFREDLYHRLNEFKIKIPSLVNRKEDLLDFIQFFMLRANTELNKNVTHVNDDVIALFRSYHWPGNIRELKNTMKRAVLLAKNNTITINELPEDMELINETIMQNNLDFDEDNTHNLKLSQEITEKELIIRALETTKYNKTKAAQLLKIDRTTLYNKIQKYKLE
jgi:two-component system response regulator HydG